jgi:transcription initiation factor TFIID subunit 7
MSGKTGFKLRLNTSSAASPIEPSSATDTPKKLTLKFGRSSIPATPAAAGPSSGKKSGGLILTHSSHGKASSSKKRKPTDEGSKAGASVKRIRVVSKGAKTPTTPMIRTKFKGKIPLRPLGVGYDSEGEDIEADPAIERDFILRMEPGPDCDYLRKAIAEKTLGLPRNKGGADVWMKFFTSNGKRAVIHILQNLYAATLVDLPCIIEGMKSWDKKAWFKSVDICQMLLVIGKVQTEAEALNAPLPPSVNVKSHQYAHGITAPMHNVRKRRFRKRVSNRTIEAVEEEVDRLLALDQECEKGSSKYEIVDLDRATREVSSEDDYEEYGSEDADGDAEPEDYFGKGAAETEDMDDMEALLQREMLGGEGVELEIETTASGGPASSTHPIAAAGTNPSAAPTPSAGDDTGDESSEGEDDDDANDDAEDEEALADSKEKQTQREEIANLKAMIATAVANYESVSNTLIRNKIENQIRSLRRDLEVKKGALGEEEEEED